MQEHRPAGGVLHAAEGLGLAIRHQPFEFVFLVETHSRSQKGNRCIMMMTPCMRMSTESQDEKSIPSRLVGRYVSGTTSFSGPEPVFRGLRPVLHHQSVVSPVRI